MDSPHLTLSPWHIGALAGRGRLLSGYGVDLTVDESAAWSVELEPAFSCCAEPGHGHMGMFTDAHGVSKLCLNTKSSRLTERDLQQYWNLTNIHLASVLTVRCSCSHWASKTLGVS